MNPMLSAAMLLIFIIPTFRCVSAGPEVFSLRKIPNAVAALLRVFFLKPTREVLIEHLLPPVGRTRRPAGGGEPCREQQTLCQNRADY